MKNVVIWTPKVYDLYSNKPVGGIATQMFFWCKAFMSNGWKVYSFSEKDNITIDNINFIRSASWGHGLELVHEFIRPLCVIFRFKPSVLVFRGAQRELYPIALWARFFNIKVLFFSASDVNFESERLPISGKNRWMYLSAVKKLNYFIVQNEHQQSTLFNNFGKQSLMLPNIWSLLPTESSIPSCDVSWVANFRPLKRAEWVLAAAAELNDFSFSMAGAEWGDKSYYENIERQADTLSNIHFWGGLSFAQSNALIGESKILLCTSEYEGFPNIFLQAWASNVPVISTVDPNGVISKNKLGVVVSSIEELTNSIKLLLSDNVVYNEYQSSIDTYFKKSHDIQIGFQKLIKYFSL